MKKYIIKNSDGSEQHVMQAVHASSKEAGETLWDYLCEHNDHGGLDSDDEDWVSPFDFIIKEVECKDVSEVITDFESARKVLGLKPSESFTVTKSLDGKMVISIEDIRHFVDEVNPKHIEALIALNKLFTIAQAWNKEDGFVPDFSDWEQRKFYPWFKYDNDTARLVCDSTGCIHVAIGYRFCFKSVERAEQFGMQFVDLYNKVFL